VITGASVLMSIAWSFLRPTAPRTLVVHARTALWLPQAPVALLYTPTRWSSRCPFEACCCDLASSVMSDAGEKVPTGGELTLFEAVDRLAV
jgi:hypothetical protein